MEFEGSVLQPNFREKEKRYRATIAGLESKVSSLSEQLIFSNAATDICHEHIKELQAEIKQLKVKHRNFKARVTAKE